MAGGTYAEAEDPLLPLESILWQFRRGGEVYRAHLDDRNVETYARRRFGLYTQLPQIAKRFGFRYALHLGFDAGRFPIRAETKRLWESPDGSSLESLLAPAAGRRPAVARVACALAAGGDDEERPRRRAPAGPLAQARSPRGISTCAGPPAIRPVLGRWTTLNDFFHLTDRPYETFRPEPDLVSDAVSGAGRGPARSRADRAAGPPSPAAGAVGGGACDPGARAGDRVSAAASAMTDLDLPAEVPALEDIES